MPKLNIPNNPRLLTLSTGSAAAFLVICIVMFPDSVFKASLTGLTIWWKVVFPALLPFLVASEIALAYGLTHALGVLIGPVMRLLFRVPGIGGWAVSIAAVAGFPAGADVTCKLRKQNMLSRAEGERLLALSHLSSPVFLFGVVAAGFFARPELGAVMAVIHFLSGLLTGLVMRLHAAKNKEDAAPPSAALADKRAPRAGLPVRCFRAMEQARKDDGRTFGKVLGDAVASAVQTLMIIGGYMMIFSVVLKVLDVTLVASWLQAALGALLSPAGIPAPLVQPLFTGVFEIHLGAYGVSTSGVQATVWQAAVIGAIVAWGGLSMHAQVKTLMHSTDLRYTPFFVSRCIHALIAFVLTFFLWDPLFRIFRQTVHLPSFLLLDERNASANAPGIEWIPPLLVQQIFVSFTAGLLLLLLAARFIRLLRNRSSS